MDSEFRWLYIEDNPADAQLVLVVLQEYRPDVRLVLVSDGDEAIDALRDTRSRDIPDLILMDFVLPRFGGIALIRHLRQLQKYRETPLIVFTSIESSEIRCQCLESGATEFLLKNSDLDTITSAICGIASRYCVSSSPVPRALARDACLSKRRD